MATFDGPNKIITLPSVVNGVLSIDVGTDLYSEWKDWVQQGDNLKFDPAFRSDGGAPLSSIINQGSYFFLNNADGWRIRPAENDGTYTFVGNLALEDTSLPAIIPTIGDFTVAIIGLQPVTQGVTPTMRAQLEYSAFQGAVTLDTTNGDSGLSLTDGTPTGTKETPVDNLADAKSIASARGFDQIDVVGTYTFTSSDTLDGYIIQGASPSKTTIVVEDGATVQNCIFRDVTLTGNLDGGNDASFCIIQNMNYIDGSILDCFLSGTLTLSGTQANILRCASAIAGSGSDDTPTIDMGGTGTDLVIRDYQGGIKLTNHTSGTDKVSIDMSSGRVIFDSTITSGLYTVRGVGSVEDNSTGTAVVNVQVLDPQNLNRSAFTDGGVYLTATGSSGTAFPTGTPSKPVGNFQDAITIANAEGLTKIFVVGTWVPGVTPGALTGSDNISGITLVGGSGSSNVVGLPVGISSAASGFERLIIYGELGGLCRINNCILGATALGNLTNVEGRVVDCIVNTANGVVQKSDGAGTLFDNCDFTTTDAVQITMDANGKAFNLRNCTGNILVTNATDTESQNINLNGAMLEFATSCTHGSFIITGNGSITDNSDGSTINTDGIVAPADIAQIKKKTSTLPLVIPT